jgi:hypothetical protein
MLRVNAREQFFHGLIFLYNLEQLIQEKIITALFRSALALPLAASAVYLLK